VYINFTNITKLVSIKYIYLDKIYVIQSFIPNLFDMFNLKIFYLTNTFYDITEESVKNICNNFSIEELNLSGSIGKENCCTKHKERCCNYIINMKNIKCINLNNNQFGKIHYDLIKDAGISIKDADVN